MTPHQITIIRDILRERQRQNELKAQGKFAYTCADIAEDFGDNEKMLVLVEEMGEVGHELNEGIGPGRSINRANLRSELIQVAAVTLAWLEAIERENDDDSTDIVAELDLR